MGRIAPRQDPPCPVCGNTLVKGHCDRVCGWWVCTRNECNTIFSAKRHMPKMMAH